MGRKLVNIFLENYYFVFHTLYSAYIKSAGAQCSLLTLPFEVRVCVCVIKKAMWSVHLHRPVGVRKSTIITANLFVRV
jgi:hypothetical protein